MFVCQPRGKSWRRRDATASRLRDVTWRRYDEERDGEELARMQRGRIEAESELGTGSQFTLATALAGNDLATFPDFPAEIRAPVGTTFAQ